MLPQAPGCGVGHKNTKYAIQSIINISCTISKYYTKLIICSK